MRAFQLSWIIVAIPSAAICQTMIGNGLGAVSPNSASMSAVSTQLVRLLTPPAGPDALPQTILVAEKADAPEKDPATLQQNYSAFGDLSIDQAAPERDLSYLAYYAYAELPPDQKPADIVLEALRSFPIGSPIVEIRRASDAFGLDFHFMKAVAKIESDFDPTQRTGSYIGLFQLSKYEFNKYGSGDITSPRDNAIAAAYKFATEAILFELDTHRNPTFSDLYLIHQQGWQGASEHVSHPERIAWQSMCATDEGREKGEKWCKRAIWANTLPAVKSIWKSVDNLTSGAFVSMWRQRVDLLYARYSGMIVEVEADAHRSAGIHGERKKAERLGAGKSALARKPRFGVALARRSTGRLRIAAAIKSTPRQDQIESSAGRQW